MQSLWPVLSKISPKFDTEIFTRTLILLGKLVFQIANVSSRMSMFSVTVQEILCSMLLSKDIIMCSHSCDCSLDQISIPQQFSLTKVLKIHQNIAQTMSAAVTLLQRHLQQLTRFLFAPSNTRLKCFTKQIQFNANLIPQKSFAFGQNIESAELRYMIKIEVVFM